ncbi:MAG TPA: excinuclease ABC subunit UvrA [Casimicrobiaceae bacterium]|nr:excinuclease ABC subunit UvrA [Casimicrobiaceae bacterium]
MPDRIVIHGARQNNLKNLSLELPLNELIVVTGVSGSGKSSLVFDTLYAEGQRRYVETFSPYARQFLDRMDKPRVERIEGIPPAIAIDQTNPVRTSRSTVGTMTELADHLKLLYARAARLHCRRCGERVARDTPDSIYRALAKRTQAAGDPRLAITFPVTVPHNFSEAEVLQLLGRQGYTRVHARRGATLDIIQDRLRFGSSERARIVEATEAALTVGQGRVDVHVVGPDSAGPDSSVGADLSGRGTGSRRTNESAGRANEFAPTVWRFSTDLHCADCDIHYQDPTPSLFSFNSPLGACETCRGFGRVIGIDFGLVVPDAAKTLREGAVKPWQTPSFRECQDDLVKYARKRNVPLDTPWRDLNDETRRWVLEGEPEWVSWSKSWPGTWYGVRRFFAWLESKAYKMHIRVLLSKYRAYTPCADCGGARLKPDALLWRLGTGEDADRVLDPARRFRARGLEFGSDVLARLSGLSLHDLMLLPIASARRFFAALELPAPLDEATDLLLTEIRARLGYLADVGLDYLTLDRQSRTLSGGEVQRINLTTALGTSLVNTLFVLDEPSIGLHPRDMRRVIGVMHRLRDAGNSLVVVEHDPQVMLAADRILDIGPGPGERGGEIVFFGPPDDLKRAQRSLTGDYLAGRRRAEPAPAVPPPDGACLEVLGVSEHNLKSIDASLPLHRLVCITGVSGSGKSTLVQDVLYAALLRAKGKPTEAPGAHRALVGHEAIADVVMIDQTPIGRTTRSNPASYVGAFDPIRKRFAATDAARERGYTHATFSFNAGNGRCPTCGGNGFEHVEMQFLSDVYLRCPDCDGRRFRADVLEVTLRGRSIADVLEMTVAEAREFFADAPEVGRMLAPLVDVGLDYLRLGQPVPTLSGGEAQRLKLAGHLAEALAPERSRPGARQAAQGKLFLFDEPTTGLHFDDVAKLLSAFRQLIATGHSLVVIEHNLDVIRAADWIIDLGPEGGEAGGEIVVAGTVADVMACAASHTGVALNEYEASFGPELGPRPPARPTKPAPERFSPGAGIQVVAEEATASYAGHRSPDAAIRIHNAREHNLKSIDVALPRDRFTVVTGISGSGKSTLAFDILFAEGQRRYLESLNAYARQFVQPASRPDVDAIFGIPPTVAIEQRTSRGGRKSTVATLTETYHFLRLLYVKLGSQHCPEHDVAIAPQSEDSIVASLMRSCRGRRTALLAPLVVARKGYYTDLAKWAAGKGFASLRVDGEFLPTRPWPRLARFSEHTIELPVAELVVSAQGEAALRAGLKRALEFGKGIVYVLELDDSVSRTKPSSPGAATMPRVHVFSTKRACPKCNRSFAELDPRLFSYNSKHGWCPTCFGTGLKLSGFDEAQTGEEIWWNAWYEGDEAVCPDCRGDRLNREALAVRFRGRSIADLARLTAAEAKAFFVGLALEGREAEIARDLVVELVSRLGFLNDVGLGYLALDRSARTLSGGEAQRIRLAAQLGSNLRGVCYILDEPTIGLHPRDNRVLLDTLAKLQAKGNTLVVVEHDEETIRRADHVIDLGPGAGSQGGWVVAEGSAEELMRSRDSVTGRFLRAPLAHPLAVRRETGGRSDALVVSGADLHNLKRLRVRIPLGRLTAITGVSGSGKSTLARDVLHANLSELVRTRRRRKSARLFGCREIAGWEAIDRVLEVDQTPIGKTPRSCPATYVGFWDAIRRLFAETTEARMRGYSASRFSFNTTGGRCPECEGQGVKTVEMSFLPDVKVACEACNGARFNPETLAVLWRGKSIGEVLALSVDDAVEFFAAHRSIHHCLRLLQDVGLGYLTLGQQSPTLSGGEAQRIKLVTELAKVRTDLAGPVRGRNAGGHTLYVLDEPTVGLHMADVEKLIRVLHRLVDAGNTVVVIEHNLDVIADADWVIDLGPEGGSDGGRIVAQGPPEAIVRRTGESHTAAILAEFLSRPTHAGTPDLSARAAD